MVNCAKCGNKIKILQMTYSYTNNKGESIKCCGECNDKWIKKEKNKKKKKLIEKRIEKEKKENLLIKNLSEDQLVIKFSEKYFPFALSLSKDIWKNLPTTYNLQYDGDIHFLQESFIFEKNEYVKFLNFFIKGNISQFNQIETIQIRLIKSYLNTDFSFEIGKSNSLLNKFPKLKFLTDDFFMFFNSGEIVQFSKLLQIIFNKYGEFKNLILFEVLNKKAKEYVTQEITKICEILDSKEKLFYYIQENCETFMNENSRFWYQEYMQTLLECANQKRIIECDSLDELRKEINKSTESRELNQFEENLLNPNIPRYNIKDVDLMSGFEFENFLFKLFNNMDYKVQQTKLSGDQGADLIIEKNKNKTVIQAKCYSGKINNSAVQQVVASIKHYKADDGMIVTNSYFTPSAIKLADSNRIRLIDRDKLVHLINKYLNKGGEEVIENKKLIKFNLKMTSLDLKCPECGFDFSHKIEDFEKKKFQLNCPNCNLSIDYLLPKELVCLNCHKSFKSIEDIKKHLKSCK